jgi:hypothetical protein
VNTSWQDVSHVVFDEKPRSISQSSRLVSSLLLSVSHTTEYRDKYHFNHHVHVKRNITDVIRVSYKHLNSHQVAVVTAA